MKRGLGVAISIASGEACAPTPDRGMARLVSSGVSGVVGICGRRLAATAALAVALLAYTLFLLSFPAAWQLRQTAWYASAPPTSSSDWSATVRLVKDALQPHMVQNF